MSKKSMEYLGTEKKILHCYKSLKHGIDSFSVVVNADDVQNKKKWYEDMGYKVS